MLKYFKDYKETDCCGCRACEQACSHKAISFVENEEGFNYPVLNPDKCVDCGLCEKVCPIQNHESVKHKEGVPYAVQNINEKDLHKSSSGGVFVAIAKYVIQNGGVVYGAAYVNKEIVGHTRVQTVEELPALMGSKYVQSDTNDTFTQVREDLKAGKLVYYTGTPCQIAALKLFLRKDYENLVTSDLICHGTPSQKAFSTVVKKMEEKYKMIFKNYSFRDKNIHGWSCSSSSSWSSPNHKTNKYVKYSRDMEAYFKAFINGDMMRMNCYQCPFACKQRCGDITIADFWGVRKMYPQFKDIHKGVGLMICNSEKGRDIWNAIYKDFYIQPISMDEAVVDNHNLIEPSVLTAQRSEVYKLLFEDYDSFVGYYYKGKYFKEKFKLEIEYFIRKHPILFSVVSKIANLRK